MLNIKVGQRSKPPPGFEFLYDLPYAQRRAAVRAITPAGFAEAFYLANK
jgi:hypothetical protein